jgi:AP-4 complex subunit epsilon-1
MVVIDCLEDSDETLKRKTLALLFKMTNPMNVQAVVDKMLIHLRGSSDEFLRMDLVAKITELAER